MTHRRLLGLLMAVAIAGVGASMSGSGVAHARDAEEQRVFRIVADVSGSEARLMAVGVSSLAKQRIRGFDSDITWAGFGEDSLDLIRDDDNDFALIDLNRVDAGQLATRQDLRAVMKYWPDDQSSAEPPASANAGYLLVVKPSMEPIAKLAGAIERDSPIG